VAKIGKNDQKWHFSTFLKSLIFLRSKNVSGVFHGLNNARENSQKSLKISQFLPILATFYEFLNHILKKIGRTTLGRTRAAAPGTYFQFDVFVIYVLYSIQNQ
jgi:hypothetical protein